MAKNEKSGVDSTGKDLKELRDELWIVVPFFLIALGFFLGSFSLSWAAGGVPRRLCASRRSRLIARGGGPCRASPGPLSCANHRIHRLSTQYRGLAIGDHVRQIPGQIFRRHNLA